MVVAPGFLCFLFAVLLLGDRSWGSPCWSVESRSPQRDPQYPVIDLNDRTQRSAFISFCDPVLIVFVIVSSVGSYQAYHYTDSDAFCGRLPYGHEPRVHGLQALAARARRLRRLPRRPGREAGTYVEALRRLPALLRCFNKYPRPIPTPVHNLRPAQETCEQCHWPEKFYGAQLKVFNHYAYDETNTPRQVRMLIKTGGGSPQRRSAPASTGT